MEVRLRQKIAAGFLAFGFAACQTAPNVRAIALLEPGARYVAMGSSFAAGPGVGDKSPNAHPNCGQSTSNYPKLLAQNLKLELVDVTCGGATTANILTISQHNGLLPQIESITPETRLVTVTIGGNDLLLARDLGIASCNNIIAAKSLNSPNCGTHANPLADEAFQILAGNLDKIAREAKARAPNARIVFLDYQAILPENGNCEAVYLSDNELEVLRTRQFRYAEIVKRTAISNNIEFFSAYEATKSHDACAAMPFMAGAMSIDGVSWAVPNFHTTQEGMTAIANGLENYLRQGTNAN